MDPNTRQTGRNPKTPPPRSPGEPGENPNPARALLAWAVVVGMILAMILILSSGPRGYQELTDESVFRMLVESNQVAKCELIRETGANNKTLIRGTRKGKEGDGVKAGDGSEIPVRFWLSVMPDTEELRAYLRQNGVTPKVVYQNPVWGNILEQFLPVIFVLGIIYFIFMRQMRSAGMGAMSFGKSRARLLNRDKQRVTFENVAGIEEAKDEVQEIIAFLKSPQKFTKLGGRIPKGVLLMGPPGTGKTLLAKAIAGEAEVPFFSISGSDFVEMFVGVGASRVRDMFEQGKKHAPCIIFIDEIDAVGRSRFTGIGGGHDEREQTLNALLVEMDGFETSDGVIIVAATNRPDVLDQALLRPGRFDRQIIIDLPTLEGREQILNIHAKKLKLAPGLELSRIARGTPGFSGADLANLLNEAALLAAREGKEGVEQKDLEEARDKVWWGRERRGRMLDQEEKRITAFHESGHAVVMARVKGGEPLHKVTIIPRGMALGATMFLPKKDRLHYTRTQMLAHLATAMGGRVAEELFLEDISSGARQDLRQATELARHMVCDWGMSPKLGPRTFGNREEMMFLGREIGRTPDYSEQTAQAIDIEVDELVRGAHKQARAILEADAARVRQLAAMLLEQETVDGRDAEDLIRLGRIRTFEERAADDPVKAPPPPPAPAATDPATPPTATPPPVPPPQPV